MCYRYDTSKSLCYFFVCLALAPSAAGARSPPWVGGADPAYPGELYLCAAGSATDREAASNAAYGNLAKTFVVQVTTSSRDALAHHQATGRADQTVQDLQVHNQVTSDAALEGVSVHETWEAPDGRVHAWACLDRPRAAAALRGQVAAADARAAAWLKQAVSPEKQEAFDDQQGASDDKQAPVIHKTARLRFLALASEATAVRDALVARWHWAAPANHIAPKLQVDATDVAARLAGALRDLRIGIWTEGAEGAACRSALVQSLAARGYRATAVQDREALAGYDLMVVATTEMEHAGSITVGAVPMQLARGLLQVEVRQGSEVLLAYETKQKAGSGSMADAKRRVLRSLTGQIAQEFGPKIDAAVRGSVSQVDL